MTTQEKMQEISPIKQKILQVLAAKNVSQYTFYKNSGVTRGILTQSNGISEDNIARFLAYFPDVSAEWLMRGEGSMNRQKNDEKTISITNVHRSNTGSIATGAAAAPSSSSEECAFLREQIKEKDARIKELTDTIVKIALK